MKKTLKLALLALFCLPAMVFTACSDDENGDLDKDQVALFKDWSGLLGEKSDKVISKVGMQPSDEQYDGENLEAQIFETNSNGVDVVVASYTDADGLIYKECVIVDSYLADNITATAATNYLASIYNHTEVDEDGWYWYSYKDLAIVYIPEDGSVMYLDTKKMKGTKAGDLKEVVKAVKAKINVVR